MTRDEIAARYRDLIDDADDHPVTESILFRLAGLFAAEPSTWEAFGAHVAFLASAVGPDAATDEPAAETEENGT